MPWSLVMCLPRNPQWRPIPTSLHVFSTAWYSSSFTRWFQPLISEKAFYRPVFHCLMPCIPHCKQAGLLGGWLLVLRLDELVCLGMPGLASGELQYERAQENCMARKDLHRCSDQRWEMNKAFSSRPEDQMQWWRGLWPLGQPPHSAKGHVLATFLAHSVHELILTRKGDNKNCYPDGPGRARQERDSCFFLSIKLLSLMLFMKLPSPEAGKVLLCAPSVFCTWLSRPTSHCVVITCFHVGLSQETMSLWRTWHFPNMVFDTWMNEWMKLMQGAYTFFKITRWQIFIGKSSLKCLRNSSEWVHTTVWNFQGCPYLLSFSRERRKHQNGSQESWDTDLCCQ